MNYLRTRKSLQLLAALTLLLAASALTVQAKPVVCGGIQGIACPKGQFCDFPAGSCHTADQQGTCVPQGAACQDIYKPVCGCDGKTYSNDCERIRVGIQKDHDGACTKR